jgi:hypothetical protein
MECHDVQFGRYVPVLQMSMLPPSSEQKKTLKMERALGITMTTVWYCDMITTFVKLNPLLQSIWLLKDCSMGLIIIRKMRERTWDIFFTATGNNDICYTDYTEILRT